MQIRVNGKALEVKAETLKALLIELEYADQIVATALNQNFVRATDRANVALTEADEVEILTPRQGG
jgi:sulfur carrier protein